MTSSGQNGDPPRSFSEQSSGLRLRALASATAHHLERLLAAALLALLTTAPVMAGEATTSELDTSSAYIATAEPSPGRALSADPVFLTPASDREPSILSVFKLRLLDLFRDRDGRSSDNVFRPYVLAGRTRLDPSETNHVRLAILGARTNHVLSLGGGGELRLRQGLVLSLDASHVVRGGGLNETDGSLFYSLGLNIDF